MKFLSKNYKLLAIPTLLLLGFIAYSNTFYSSFHLDDVPFITGNFAIKDIHNLGSIWNFWPTRFITHLSFAFNYHFNKLNVFGYHVFNWFVHLGTVILALYFYNLIFSTPLLKNEKISQHARVISLLSACIFLTHPIQTESVTYIYQRATSLAGFFYLLSVVCYIKSRLLTPNNQFLFQRSIFYISSWFLCFLGMLTKENVVMLPCAIFLCEFCFFKTAEKFSWKYVLPFFILLPFIPVMLFFVKPPTFIDVDKFVVHPSTGFEYGITQLRVMMTYIRLLLVPLNQNLDYAYPMAKSLLKLPILASFFFLCFIFVMAIRLFSRYRLISFGIFWFFITLLPESNIIPLNDVIFEHRLYVPLIGFSLFVVSGAYYLFGKNNLKAMTIVLSGIIACYLFLAYTRNAVWKNEFTLWYDTVQKSPHKARPYTNLGVAYVKEGNLAQAVVLFKKAIEIDPRHSTAYNNLGRVYRDIGRSKDAIVMFKKAIEIAPRFSDAYVNLCKSDSYIGKRAEAFSACGRAIKINPYSAEGSNNLGALYHGIGKDDAALQLFKKAIKINPDYAEGYGNLGVLYFVWGEREKALFLLKKAIELDPFYAESYCNLGAVFAAMGKKEEAIILFKKAVEIRPTYAEAYGNLSLAYFEDKQYNLAVRYYNKAKALGFFNSFIFEKLKSVGNFR